MRPGNPETDNRLCPMFTCYMVGSTETKTFGVLGYVQTFAKNKKSGGQIYYRDRFEYIEYVGTVTWA